MAFDPAKERDELIKLQHGLCCWCGEPFTATGTPREATLEHVKPKMHGGTNARANLAAACRQCNQDRGNRMNEAKQEAAKRKKAARLARPTSALRRATARKRG
ncbi:HNH endonuclease [Mesorhizobium sp. WSM4976]|uniref:HNH endonuclease n=1 Tax=Mesorhizobium sp. WSM4976 TaxID=3038549 RepID=UPI002417B4A3|nr:HNH endonuclease [Mesorhizobium sp. WSM4976]MDG4898838.1 HNH endonuclease [Mesorhizobium sp. WSM4976]